MHAEPARTTSNNPLHLGPNFFGRIGSNNPHLSDSDRSEWYFQFVFDPPLRPFRRFNPPLMSLQIPPLLPTPPLLSLAPEPLVPSPSISSASPRLALAIPRPTSHYRRSNDKDVLCKVLETEKDALCKILEKSLLAYLCVSIPLI